MSGSYNLIICFATGKICDYYVLLYGWWRRRRSWEMGREEQIKEGKGQGRR